jgi:hypothetical protein
MTRYERVRVEGRAIYLRDTAEITMLGEQCLTGTEVTRDGDDVRPRGADERRRIIALELITARTPLIMDNFYGTLAEEVTS